MSQNIVVGISDLQVAERPDVLVTYALGSCVGICLYDPQRCIAGLSHIMLPSSTLSNNPKDTYKFADTAIPFMYRLMLSKGAQQRNIRAKIAGGAKMFAAINNSSIANIGQRNVEAVKQCLQQLKIPVVAEDTGKDYGRTVYFFTENGIMKVKSVNRGEFDW
jgi:chemotaxis protein CheD